MKASRNARGQFVKGSPAPKSAFKKGNRPWNARTKDYERERKRKAKWAREHGKGTRKRTVGYMKKYLKEYYLRNKKRFAEKGKEYRRSRKDEIAGRNKEYYRKNKGKIASKAKAYRKENKEKISQKKRDYYLKHHEKEILKRRAWRAKNPEHAKELAKRWKKKNPERLRVSHRNRKARLREAGGSFTIAEWLTLRDATGGYCPRCKRQVSVEKLTIDHIVPIKKGGSNFITNIQPLCGRCNSSKGAKIFATYWCADCGYMIEVEVKGTPKRPEKCPKCRKNKIVPWLDEESQVR